jgi:putative DNA primase/helicase
VDAMVSLTQPDVPIQPDQLDQNPWLLNCQNGTIDLQTGQLQPHNTGDYITKCVPVAYDPAAECPLWESFLSDIFEGNQELIVYVWKALGYSMTGFTTEQCLWILHGSGQNGKSTFLEVLQLLLADYAETASPSTFLHQDRETVRNDVAKLRSARFVSAIETEDGRRLSEVMVKQMTGGDAITARFLFAEYFSFKPSFKIWLATNHKPDIRGTDLAMWRRIRLIPFNWTVPEKQLDKSLPDKLPAELPGILAWCVRGCLEWQAAGLEPPEIVQAAINEYRAEQDVLGNFLTERCRLGGDFAASARDLYEAYRDWAESNGETAHTQHRFGKQLRERGLKNERSSATGRKIWRGIYLWEEKSAEKGSAS